MPADARASLADDQARLVAALAGRGHVPDGFDAARVSLAATTLVAKRRKCVARARPMLAGSLGDRFVERFAAFAAAEPPHPGGPAADGQAFAEWLDRQGLLPEPAVPELLAASLWHRRRRFGVRVRRASGRIWLAIRLPALGVRLLSLPPLRGRLFPLLPDRPRL